MATTVIQTRVDAVTKREAELLFESLGLDLTTAIRLFLHQSINQQRIPFDIVPPKYNSSKEIIATVYENAKNKDDSVKSYPSAKELFEDRE